MSEITSGNDNSESMYQSAFAQYETLLKSAFEKGNFRAVMQASYTVAEKYFEAAKAATDENPEIDEQSLMATASRYVAEEFMPSLQTDLDAVESLSSILARAKV
ncbi:hypothetical protein [Paraburkholderia ginsengisoli]|jgi:thiaminase|uniref:DUF3144 domain-containing protein n=1 Tax=Paraburkholderia ginsengisoli TaxID=311231 RepID=A0A7T4T7Z6_9BURK|nr:hypothetical protein [Paraburkholderia ginsengisoli]QQC63154.1 hypothetical protein I6I06_12650 [Paraburkholderia ginsengisoli]